MRRVALVVGLGALFGTAPVFAGMAVRDRVYDFGAVEQGARVTHQFVVENTGRAMVRIEETASSCGCTVAVAEGSLLKPGARMAVAVTLDTASIAGRTTKTVTLRTSDPQARAVQMALTGVVLTDLVVSPSPLYLGRVYFGEPMRRELLVTPGRPGNSAYVVSSVEVDSSYVRASLEPGAKPGEQKIVVELGFDPPRGRFNDELIIHTTSPRQPVIKVSVFGQVVG